ncbi:hypothetical protein BGW37DRAFT_480507 [Umbelopsis sp. PMI_123]|nr:hypothetical protein BGW37DRAFT_480507 [Umbelopsis sp. PMI_123]
MQGDSQPQAPHDKPLPSGPPPSSNSSQAPPQHQPPPQPQQQGYSTPPHQSYPPQPQGYQQYPHGGQGQHPNYQGVPSAGFHSAPSPQTQGYPNQYAHQQGPPPLTPNPPQGYYQQNPPPPGANSPHGYYQQGLPPNHPGYPHYQPAPPANALYDIYGMPTAEHQRYSATFFNFLDSNYAPQNSRAIEQTKIKAFMESLGVDKNRNIGALPANMLEDFYTHFGIPFTKKMGPPTVANAVNVASTVFKGASILSNVLGAGTGLGGGGLMGGFGGGMGRGSQTNIMIPVIDNNGFTTLFSNAVKRNPNGMFIKLNEVIQKFRLPVPVLQRNQLPMNPDPLVIEQYKSYEQIMMMKMQMKMKSTQMMANVVVQGAHNVQEASLPAGYTYRYT